MADNGTNEGKSVPFYPDHLAYEAKVALWFGIGLIGIGIIGLFFPMGLGDPADPMITPEHTKPEWYFLALYQLLKYLPKTIGAVAPVLLVLTIFIWPFLDRRKDRSKKATRNRLVVTVFLVVITICLTILGEIT
jgi:ubiquinol-cytochrome c reductase cytochrome b subunit/cytochrome b6